MKSKMESTWLFFLILTTIIFADNVQSQHIHASKNPVAVGSNVTIFSTDTVDLGSWRFNEKTIVSIYPGGAEIFMDRITFNSSTSSLTIESVTLNDSGVYMLEKLREDGFLEKLELSVQVPISNVTLQAKANSLVEFNDTAVLKCSAAIGTSLSYEWMKDNTTITDGVQFSSNKDTLTIANVTRDDMGQYSCIVSNGLGNKTTNIVYLNINYGPSHTTIMVMPTMEVYKSGSNITLSCATDSNPEATIQWMFDDKSLNHSDQTLQLQNVAEKQTGLYKCVFYNSVTLRSSNVSARIWVMDPISAVVIRHASGPAILHESFTLKCDVTGPVDSIQWMKDGEIISVKNRTTFGEGNKTLTLNPVEHSDGGYYKCWASNCVSNMTSGPFEVHVNYGPEMPTITGSNVVKRGDNVTLRCNAKSTPTSSYKWHFDGDNVSNMSEYVTPPLTKELSGKYVCMAFNNITGKNSSTHIMITVVDPIEKVEVEGQMEPAVENSSYKLMCTVTGDADHIYWMKNDEHLNSSTIIFSMGKNMVTFMPVERSDSGEYQCMAKNAFGNMTSDPYNLVVNYGPETPMVGGRPAAETGSYVDFTCSAVSEPPSYFTWWFNDTQVANTSDFTAGPMTLNMSGEYTCKAHNPVTRQNSTKSTSLTVIEAMESVKVQNKSTPINQQNFTLVCEVVGPYNWTYWMKDGMYLNTSTMGQNMSYYVEKNMLHFTPVTRADDGTYTCIAVNQAANHSSVEYILQVNYGPVSVTISGPVVGERGDPISLSCSADSRPDCEFYWYLNNHLMSEAVGSVVSVFNINEYVGNYTCVAKNPVTNITMFQHKTLTIPGHASTIHLPTQGGLMMMGMFALSAHMLLR
ncbi:carcinoembryonic antigen-related cell adhesion molecule 1 [Menidia menidia]